MANTIKNKNCFNVEQRILYKVKLQVNSKFYYNNLNFNNFFR